MAQPALFLNEMSSERNFCQTSLDLPLPNTLWLSLSENKGFALINTNQQFSIFDEGQTLVNYCILKVFVQAILRVKYSPLCIQIL